MYLLSYIRVIYSNSLITIEVTFIGLSAGFSIFIISSLFLLSTISLPMFVL